MPSTVYFLAATVKKSALLLQTFFLRIRKSHKSAVETHLCSKLTAKLNSQAIKEEFCISYKRKKNLSAAFVSNKRLIKLHERMHKLKEQGKELYRLPLVWAPVPTVKSITRCE